MFPLAAIGSGLGQFAQEYRQQQESKLRQMQVRMALQEFQRQNQAKSLLGQVLSAGGIPGFGGMKLPQGETQPMQAMPQAGAPGAPMMPSPAPMAPAPAASPGPRVLTEDQQDAMERGPAQLSPEQADQTFRAAGASESRAGVPLEPEPAPSPSAAPAASPPAPAMPQTDVAAPIQTHDEMSQYLSMFQHADPSAIARRIKEVRPDAPDDAVWTATQELYKLTSGNIREQLAAASMLKFLKGNELQREKAIGMVGGVPTVAAQNAATARGNLATRQQTQQRLSAQFQQKTAQFNSRLAEIRNSRDATTKRTALEGLRKAIEKQLYPGFGAEQPSPEERVELQRQMVEVQNEMRRGAGMTPLPAPQAAPTPAE